MPIRIDGPVVEGLEFGTRPLRGAQWSQYTDPDGQPRDGRERHSLPKSVQPGEHITMWLEIRKYDCQGGVGSIDRVPVRWSVLGRARQTDWMLNEENELTAPIAYCYPDTALKYVSR